MKRQSDMRKTRADEKKKNRNRRSLMRSADREAAFARAAISASKTSAWPPRPSLAEASSLPW